VGHRELLDKLHAFLRIEVDLVAGLCQEERRACLDQPGGGEVEEDGLLS